MVESELRILLVDDDVSVASGLATLLSTYGCTTEIVHLGGEAIGAAESFAPDVVILDVHLPDINGDEVFRRLRSRWPELPVIFSSGHVHHLSDVIEGEPRRVLLLQKPYEGDQLIDAIRRVRQ